MGCNCKVTEIVLGVLILIFVWWQVWIWDWIITILAALLIIHALRCKNCSANVASAVGKPIAKATTPKAKSKKKK